jgi:2-keto-3-deoxy-L-rhamnonate aldolase RhmA
VVQVKNLLKEKLKQNQTVIGTFVSLGHPDVTEMLAGLGFDWLLLDAEHGPLGYETMQCMMQAMNGSGCTPIVRPQWNDFVAIKRALDIGAHGILVPMINTREEAERAVSACKYPPLGIRGAGPRRAALFDQDYMTTADEEIMVIAQIETPEAIENQEEILRVDGIDACYVGPFDLARNMGLAFPDFKNSDFLAAFDRIIDSARNAGKPAGLYAGQHNIEWAVQKGFVLNTVDNADTFLMRGAISALKKFRDAAKSE